MGKDERDSVMAFGEIFFAALEVAGTISFAISGAMAALEKRVDLFGVIFLGATTALAAALSGMCLLVRHRLRLFQITVIWPLQR